MPSLNFDHLPLKIVNTLAFFFFFGSNLYSSLSPNGYHGGKETYVTPGDDFFYVWSAISVLLLGFVIFQFFDRTHEAIHGVGWRFPLLAVLNSVFVHTFATGHYLVAFIFSLLVASTATTIYYSLSAHYHAQDLGDTLFVHLPFSLWHAFSVVTAFISAFSAFTHGVHGRHPGVTVDVLAVLSIAFITFSSIGYAVGTKKGDLAGGIVLSWYLFSVYGHQHHAKLIHFSALAGGILSLFSIVKTLYFTFVRGDGQIALGDSERAPLIGGN